MTHRKLTTLQLPADIGGLSDTCSVLSLLCVVQLLNLHVMGLKVTGCIQALGQVRSSVTCRSVCEADRRKWELLGSRCCTVLGGWSHGRTDRQRDRQTDLYLQALVASLATHCRRQDNLRVTVIRFLVFAT